METTAQTIPVETTIHSPVEKVWNYWTSPEHIMKWCSASDDWHVPLANNDLRKGGSFQTRMEAKDGSFGFDFGGVYDEVKEHALLEYTLGDARKVKIVFTPNNDQTQVVETFDAEGENPIEMQHSGWQSILDNFRKYAEGK